MRHLFFAICFLLCLGANVAASAQCAPARRAAGDADDKFLKSKASYMTCANKPVLVFAADCWRNQPARGLAIKDAVPVLAAWDKAVAQCQADPTDQMRRRARFLSRIGEHCAAAEGFQAARTNAVRTADIVYEVEESNNWMACVAEIQSGGAGGRDWSKLEAASDASAAIMPAQAFTHWGPRAGPLMQNWLRLVTFRAPGERTAPVVQARYLESLPEAHFDWQKWQRLLQSARVWKQGLASRLKVERDLSRLQEQTCRIDAAFAASADCGMP